MKYTFIETQVEEEILLVKLNRPRKRNAINDETIREIEDCFSNISPELKCAILHGEGEHFSAGLDLSELKERNAVDGYFHSRMWHQAMEKIQFGKIPVIAVMHGACIGGGLELASACHLRVAEESAFYALPEGQRGIFVGGGASVRLPKLIGLHRLTDMMLTGRVYAAPEGMTIGFSQYLVDTGHGLEKAKELAHKISTNTRLTNYGVMHVLPRIQEDGQESGLMLESFIAAITQDSPEAKNRLRDFLDGLAKKVRK